MSETNQETTNTADSTDNVTGAEGQEKKKRRKVRRTFDRQFSRMRKTMALSKNHELLKQYAAEGGYTAEKIAEGQTFFDAVDTSYQEQKSAMAAQLEATRVFLENKDKANKTVQYFVDLARLEFKENPGIYKELGLHNRRALTYGEWVAHNKYFYTKILSIPEALAGMGNHNVTQEQLAAGEQELTDTLDAEVEQEKAKALAQRATHRKNSAFRVFKKWYRRYINIMREVLEDDPQLKEELGIITPSEE